MSNDGSNERKRLVCAGSARINRRAMMRGVVMGGALTAGVAGAPAVSAASNEANGAALNVKEHGVRGDGETHEADRLQELLNGLAEQGGGIAVFPPGRYILEKTLRIPSGVHVIGHGVSTVFEGYRPDGVDGYALIANDGIVTAEGYDGASDFSLRDVALDSPRTNGIVLVHARNGYFANIHGLDAYHHHFDIAGSKNIVVENVFLTGRSGTAPFQIDGSPFYNNTWDGETNVQPIQDGTPNDGIFLSNSVIHPANRPNHGIHFHRDHGQNIFIDNVLIEHLENGIFRDGNTHRKNVFINNVVIRNVTNRGVNFRPTDTPDERVSMTNVIIEDVSGPGLVEYHGCRDLTLRNVKAQADPEAGAERIVLDDVALAAVDGAHVNGAGAGSALWLRDCRNVTVSNLTAQHVSRSLRLEDCANIRYSGIAELDEHGQPREAAIEGAEYLAPWNHSG